MLAMNATSRILSLAFLFSLACGASTKGADSPTPGQGGVSAPVYANATEAAEALLDAMNIEVVLAQSIDQALETQIKANPSIAAMRPVFEQFFEKHMSWKSLRTDFVELYVSAFEQNELEDLIRFYETDTGKKSISLMPELLKRGSEIGAKKVQDNLPDLQRMIREAQ